MCDADNAKPATSSCNEHPYGCGDLPHSDALRVKRVTEEFSGFLRTVPTRFTRAEIQVLRDRAYGLSSSSLGLSPVETMYLRLAETLDLLDAVMARDEEKVRGPECDETEELDEDWLKKLSEELRRGSPQQGCPTCSRRPSPPHSLWPRRIDDDWDGRIGPC